MGQKTRKTPQKKPDFKHADLAAFIDHTLLKPDATAEAIDTLCREAIDYRFASVCVNPVNVPRAVKNLDQTGIPVAAVVGFPLGANTWEIKAAETRDLVARGAREIDMVINIGALKNADFRCVFKDIEAVTQAAQGCVVKVILETALLSHDEKVAACILAKAAGATFVKTSTGFGPSGATAEDVALMRKIVGSDMGVKASGGIRDTATARAMIAAGATRLGASASVAIVKGS
ncbi:deoxyribose-phosphate aldolase [bacterium]|nr:deoxyribose-phosphate aldolase [candidate division CSSED10-310 bacterium]